MRAEKSVSCASVKVASALWNVTRTSSEYLAGRHLSTSEQINRLDGPQLRDINGPNRFLDLSKRCPVGEYQRKITFYGREARQWLITQRTVGVRDSPHQRLKTQFGKVDLLTQLEPLRKVACELPRNADADQVAAVSCYRNFRRADPLRAMQGHQASSAPLRREP